MSDPVVETTPSSWRWWLSRALAGIAFGFASNGVVLVCELGLLIVGYGSLDAALKEMRPSQTSHAGFAAFFAASPASFLGAFIAPFALGRGSWRRLNIVLSSVLGAVLATIPAAALGSLAGWMSWQNPLRWEGFIWIALALGTAAGICGGWIGGSCMRSSEAVSADDDESDSSGPTRLPQRH